MRKKLTMVRLLLVGTALAVFCSELVLAQEPIPTPPGPAPLCQCGKGTFLSPRGSAANCAAEGTSVIIRNSEGSIQFPPLLIPPNLRGVFGNSDGTAQQAEWKFFRLKEGGVNKSFWGWGCEVAGGDLWIWASALDSTTVLAQEPEVATSTTQQSSATACTHIVQAGENLFRISQKYGMTTGELAQLNGISDPSLIHIGQVLQLRCQNSTSVPPQAAVVPTSLPPATVTLVPVVVSTPTSQPTSTPVPTPTSFVLKPTVVPATPIPTVLAIPTVSATALPTPSTSENSNQVQSQNVAMKAMFAVGLSMVILAVLVWLFFWVRTTHSQPITRSAYQPAPVQSQPRRRKQRVSPKPVRPTGKSVLVGHTSSLIKHQKPSPKPKAVRIGDVLGQGGQGIVKKERRGGQTVAVKYTTTERVGLEVDILRAVGDSPYFPAFFSSTTLGTGQVEIVMGFVEGESLAQMIKRRGMIPIPLVTIILKSVAEGLKYLHNKGYVYVDLKPSQIMITPQNRVVIIDPGSGARISEPPVTATPGFSHPKTWTNTPKGSVVASVPTNPDFDTYSLGVLAHGLVTGEWPPVPPKNWKPDLSEARYFRLPRMRSVVERAFSRWGRLEDFI